MVLGFLAALHKAEFWNGSLYNSSRVGKQLAAGQLCLRSLYVITVQNMLPNPLLQLS